MVGVGEPGLRVSGIMVGVRGLALRVSGIMVGVRGLALRVSGIMVGVRGLAVRVSGIMVGVRELALRVSGIMVGVRQPDLRVSVIRRHVMIAEGFVGGRILRMLRDQCPAEITEDRLGFDAASIRDHEMPMITDVCSAQVQGVERRWSTGPLIGMA
jgi:hypothetical protein